MANLTELTTVVSDLFDVLDVVITRVVDLLTGNLLVLLIVGAFIALIVGLIYLILDYVKSHMTKAVKMKR